jgi:hypothetical protein
MRRADLLVAVVVLGLAGWAVAARLSAPPPPRAPASPVLAIGGAVPADLVLGSVDGERHRLGDLFGPKATVLYSWSTTCPCIPWCEDELTDIAGRYDAAKGVTWVAIDGEPTDTVEGIHVRMKEVGAFYDVLLDPTQALSRRMGFDRAAIVAVLDAEGRLRFRGNPSDRLKDPKRWFLNEVLADVVAGKEPSITHAEPTYGCEFSPPPRAGRGGGTPQGANP